MIDFEQTCPPFAAMRGSEAAERHAQVASDGVEDLLQQMIKTWEKDDLYLAPQMAETLRAPLLDLLAGATVRLKAEVLKMYSAIDDLQRRTTPFEE
ncbi:hypothetical protein [Corynebacterium flavescens]|uniref:hypothetical protein n=1 Tax=Corynebacterium flavescens TaxID=28028 RepID=UPI0028A2853A|nr:hypothetical protein [Corynebacterium flavescens]